MKYITSNTNLEGQEGRNKQNASWTVFCLNGQSKYGAHNYDDTMLG